MVKLWLALEDRDSGWDVMATEATKQDLEAWYAASPNKIQGSQIGIVEAKKEMIVTHWEPVTVVPKQFQRGKGLVAVSDLVLTIDEMKTWAAEKGRHYPWHKLNKNNWNWYLYLADSEVETNVIGGKFESIIFCPLTVSIFDPTVPLEA